ncbi:MULTISPECIES: MFS transporter [unclassified Beijerinckia]|uniref:MFS transporter n=1 Tax=unclassified Beijerinckia TaxID=2638183 RepID=UPI00089AD1AC|nr:MULTISPECIES: MFS transporter [unclassified Beijerinckia]MDH7798690.1 MFS family permease [Beijerinckia sp. GAS462]SED29528.1 Sugar phosphate permease [Beijerinckia sp. 28-YEA-48]
MSVSTSSAPVHAYERISGRGWLLVAVCLIGISAGPAAFGIASLGLFIEVFEKQFGWSRTEVSSAASVMMICTAISMPFVGRLVDRIGPRRVLIPSIVLLGLCMLAIPFLVTQFWQFMLIYVLMGTIAAGTNSVPYMRVLASWFDRSRGLAIGIAGSGTGLGFAYVPLVGHAAISQFGWQAGYVVLGLIMFCIVLPLVFFFLKETPDGGQVEDNSAAKKDLAGMSLSEAMRQRNFWLLAAIFITLAFVLYGLIPHLTPMLTDRGLTAAAAAGIASLFGFATFGGRVFIGFLIDKFDARLVAVTFFSISALGLLLLAVPLPDWAIVVAAVLLGGSLGAEVDMLAYMTSRYFGLKCFAEIFGVIFGAVLVAMGLGPMAFGLVFDKTGSYQAILLIGAPACLLAAALMFLLPPIAQARRGAAISVT